MRDEAADGLVQPCGGCAVGQAGLCSGTGARGWGVDQCGASPTGRQKGRSEKEWLGEQKGLENRTGWQKPGGLSCSARVPSVAPVPRGDMLLPGCLEVRWRPGVTAPSQQPSCKAHRAAVHWAPGTERWEHQPLPL